MGLTILAVAATMKTGAVRTAAKPSMTMADVFVILNHVYRVIPWLTSQGSFF